MATTKWCGEPLNLLWNKPSKTHSEVEKYDEKKVVKQLADPRTQREAFGKVVGQFSEPLYWQIRHIVLTHEDADDVLQNTFIKAWNSLSSFRGDSKLSTWLYRIAVNESLDFVRRKRNVDTVDAAEATGGVAAQLVADRYFDGDEAEALLQEAIATLPEVQRTVFTMRYYEEMKYSEMSRILGTSEGALKASYHIAVKKISAYFDQRD